MTINLEKSSSVDKEFKNSEKFVAQLIKEKKKNDDSFKRKNSWGKKNTTFVPIVVHPTTKDSTRRGRGGTAGYKIAINNRPREFFVAGHKSPRQSSPRFFRATFPSSSVLHACRQRAARWPFFPPFVSVVRRR